jgi:hypothetical protein
VPGWYNDAAVTRLRAIALAALATLVVWTAPAAAQGPPPKIGPFAIDFHATVPRFPTGDPQLSDSRALLQAELPGAGLGLHGAATLYPIKWRAVTFGFGVDATVARARRASRAVSTTTVGRAVTERFSHIAPDISFNFGTGDGWSYISGGIGPGVWYLVPDGGLPMNADDQRLQTINYGGGARWFLNRHVAFSLDVRFYAVAPSAPDAGRPSSPRTTLLFLGGGVSLKQ